MKFFISFILFSFTSQVVNAQKKFEGIVVYEANFHSTHQKYLLVVYFKKSKLRVTYKTPNYESTGKMDRLFDFEKCLQAFVRTGQQPGYGDLLIKVTSLTNPRLKTLNQKHKKILGYYNSGFEGIDSSNITLSEPQKFFAWYADSLFYNLPKEYLTTGTVRFSNGNNVCLKFVLNPGKTEKVIDITAISVTHQILPDSIFETKAILENKSDLVFDSTAQIIDSTITAKGDTAALNKYYRDLNSKIKNRKKTTKSQLIKSPVSKPKE